MRIKRILLWTTVILLLLLAGLLAAGGYLVYFYPWEEQENRILQRLNEQAPVHVAFNRLGFSWKRGIGLSAEQVRISEKREKRENGKEGAERLTLTADRIIFRPALGSFRRREVRANLILESPVVMLPSNYGSRLSQTGDENRTDTGNLDGKGKSPLHPPAALPELIPLPAGLTLTEISLSIRDGTIRLQPETAENDPLQQEVSQLQADLHLNAAFNFRLKLKESLVIWTQNDQNPFRVSGRLSGSASGSCCSEAPNKASSHAPGNTALYTFLPLPEWLSLAEASLSLKEGMLQMPSTVSKNSRSEQRISQVEAVFRLDAADDDFRLTLKDSHLLRTLDDKHPFSISGRLSGMVRGHTVSPEGPVLDGTLTAGNLEFRDEQRQWKTRDFVTLDFQLSKVQKQQLTASAFHLAGPGLDIRTKGSLKWKGPQKEISCQSLKAEIDDWNLLTPLLPANTDISGRLSLEADTVKIRPAEGLSLSFQQDSFRESLLSGLQLEGLRAEISDGKLRLAFSDEHRLNMEGLQATLEKKQGKGWAGKLRAAMLEAVQETFSSKTQADSLRFSGPVSVQGKSSEGARDTLLVLVVDLSGGRLQYQNLVDKPADVFCQAGLRARFGTEKIEVGKAFLHLGEMALVARGSVTNPGKPFMEMRLATNTLPLDSLTVLSPLAREHGLGGLLSIKALEVNGELQSLKETGNLKARVSGKDLALHNTVVKGLYAQAAYGNQLLTLTPLVIHPGQGIMEASFTADFSDTYLSLEQHQYYGTLKLNNIALNQLITLTCPEFSDRAFGNLDVNLAMRGTGLKWQDAAPNLEAKARVYLHNFSLAEGDAEKGGAEKGAKAKSREMLEHLANGDISGPEVASSHIEEKRLLTSNQASALLSLQEKNITTRNLVAIYEGKVIEIQGALDFSGRLRVDQGRVFFKNKMVPIVPYSCHPGKDSCTPSPDIKAMGKIAATELYNGLRLLSTGASGVFDELLF